MKFPIFLLASILFLSGAASVAGEPSSAPTAKPVVMTPYKVSPSGWNVRSMLYLVFWGNVCTTSVSVVDRGSFADKAGLREGDQILRINGKPVRGMNEQEMERLLWPHDPAAIALDVQAKGAKEPRKVVLNHPGAAHSSK